MTTAPPAKSLAYRIREFKADDLDSVVAINRACLPENYPPFFFLMIYRNCPKGFLVAEYNGKVVGYVMSRVEFGFSYFGAGAISKGHIISIAVLPEYRRKGIATALMLGAMKALKEYGAKECFLEVRVSNLPAISLYRKLGFQIVQRVPAYYRDGEDAYVMAAVL